MRRRVDIKAPTLVLVVLLWGCSGVDIKPDGSYSRVVLVQQKPLPLWTAEGRAVASTEKTAVSANLIWTHRPGQEQLKLSGPLGQGGVIIRFNSHSATIDRGQGQVQSSDDPNGLVGQTLGLNVPVTALPYWMVGLPQPDRRFVETPSGFQQDGWLVEYKEMRQTADWSLPRKMVVLNGRAKLKLMIDQWVVEDVRR